MEKLQAIKQYRREHFNPKIQKLVAGWILQPPKNKIYTDGIVSSACPTIMLPMPSQNLFPSATAVHSSIETRFPIPIMQFGHG